MSLLKMLGIVKNEGNEPMVEDVVITSEKDVMVVTSVKFPKDAEAIRVPTYFAKELKKEIPALSEVIVGAPDGAQAISVKMVIPITDCDGNPNNTVDDIVTLRKMGIGIIGVIVRNSSIPELIKAIGDDCKPWFDEDEEAQ